MLYPFILNASPNLYHQFELRKRKHTMSHKMVEQVEKVRKNSEKKKLTTLPNPETKQNERKENKGI